MSRVWPLHDDDDDDDVCWSSFDALSMIAPRGVATGINLSFAYEEQFAAAQL